MKPEDIRELLSAGEGQRIEFKTSFQEQDAAIETLCAFTHCEGGSVLFGVAPDGSLKGVTIGRNTLELFSSRLREKTVPMLHPVVEHVVIDGKTIVVATIPKAGDGELHHFSGRSFIRVGRSNHPMDPSAQRARLTPYWERASEERDRPRFDVRIKGLGRRETEFTPEFAVVRAAGDVIAQIEWRLRGPRFEMDWRSASGLALERTTFVHTQDLSTSGPIDDRVGLDQMGFEIRFHWRGAVRHELHRWPITRKELPNKVLWDIGSELLPVDYTDETSAAAG